MGILIDTSVLIEYERGGVDLEERATGREEEAVFLSVISVSELLHGVHRAEDRTRRAHRSAFVEGVLEGFQILPIDPPTARMHAGLWTELSASGQRIGAHDLWIAAAALAHGLSLATANLRDFERVHELTVEDWASRE